VYVVLCLEVGATIDKTLINDICSFIEVEDRIFGNLEVNNDVG